MEGVVGMAFDSELAERIRDALAPEPTLEERKMFGGLAFLIDGRMAVAARGGGGLMVRVDPADAPGLVETTSAEYVEMRGRPMKGWLHVDVRDIESEEALDSWIDRAVSYTATVTETS